MDPELVPANPCGVHLPKVTEMICAFPPPPSLLLSVLPNYYLPQVPWCNLRTVRGTQLAVLKTAGLLLGCGALKGHKLRSGGDNISAICGWCTPLCTVWLIMDSSVVPPATYPKSPHGVRKKVSHHMAWTKMASPKLTSPKSTFRIVACAKIACS